MKRSADAFVEITPSTSRKKPLIWSIMVFVSLALVWWGAQKRFERHIAKNIHGKISQHLTIYGNLLSTQIERRFAALDGLAAFVQSNIHTGKEINATSFAIFAAGLHQNSTIIRNFSIAPGGIQRHVFPMVRNRPVQGHDLLHDPRPKVQADVKRAIDTDRIVTSGPYDLRQGGLGLVARKAIYHDGEFWGLVAMVLDLPPLLSILEEDWDQNEVRLSLALRDGGQRVFYGKDTVFQSDAVVFTIKVPDDSWELGAIPINGWRAVKREQTLWFHVVSFVLLAVITSLFYLGLSRQARLSLAVAKRTRQIIEANQRLEEDFQKRIALEKEGRKMATRLRQAQKIEAIGVLAGGIAHDFNNLLFPIIGYVEMLIEDVPTDSSMRESLQEVHLAAKRASELVRQILAFSHKADRETQPIAIQLIIKEALKLCRSTLPATICIEKRISASCSMVRANPTQIHQVVMNLIMNAYHAMEDCGGTMKVTLQEVDLGAGNLPDGSMAPGKYASFCVSDTGTGMDRDTLDRIFDPYFTTKEKAKGTGLGLAVVHGIITNLDGKIFVQSDPGAGTKVDVFLPCPEEDLYADDAPPKRGVETGTERILLVDDEEQITRMVALMLTRLGYKAVAYNSSVDALEDFRAASGQYDLVITDLTMPSLTGERLSEAIKAVAPDMPVILCTGYNEKMDEDTAQAHGIDLVLAKPVAKEKLAKAIRSVLDP